MQSRIDRRAFHDPVRLKVAQQLQRPGLVLLQGGKAFHIHDTDTENVFRCASTNPRHAPHPTCAGLKTLVARQEGYFQYLFGVCEEDYLGALDTRSNPPKSLLFMPRLPESYAVWMGHIDGPQDKQAQYAVDQVHYADELHKVVAAMQPDVVYLLEGVNSDRCRDVPVLLSFSNLHPVSAEGLSSVAADRRARQLALRGWAASRPTPRLSTQLWPSPAR